MHLQFRAASGHPSENPDLDTCVGALFEDADHLRIAHFRIVNKQLLLRALQESGELFARIHGTDDKIRLPSRVGLTHGVGLEQLDSLRHQFFVSGNKAEASAVFEIQRRKIKREYVELAPVDNHHLPVIAGQIVSRASYRDSLRQQPHLQLPQILFTTAIRISDEGMNEDPSVDRVDQGLFNLAPVESKDENFDALFGAINRLHQGRDTVARLYHQFHTPPPSVGTRPARTPTGASPEACRGITFADQDDDHLGLVNRMLNKSKKVTLLIAGVLMSLPAAQAAKKTHKTKPPEAEITGTVRTMLWRQPNDIRARNLFYGPGGAEHAPHSTYTFLKEDLKGSNPKFDVEDENGTKWKVKLGSEARPETVASRLVWAVGYFANEDYFVPVLHVREFPAKLHRGPPLVEPDGTSYDTRLKRELKDEKKIGVWHWRSDPFAGTREWNGLRVLMALINNWDLKDENNAIYEEKPAHGSDELQRVYMVSDLGASFGDVKLTRDRKISKGNLGLYQNSKFIDSMDSEYVNFENPHRPAAVVLVNPHEYFSRIRLDWIGKRVPRTDARWIGELLAQLSTSQIRDAFRAAGYAPQVVDGFTAVLESRIAELKKL